MTQEKAGFGEQALSKIVEMALERQLKAPERLSVQIKTDLSKLAHGEVDSITIGINGLVLKQDLSVEKLQLKINRVTVKPFSALRGKIQLTQPSEGTACIVITEDNLTHAFNSKSFREHLYQMQGFVEDRRQIIHIQQMKCRLLADGNMAFNSELILGKTGEPRAFAFTATPHITTDGQRIVLQDVHSVEEKEFPSELKVALIAQASEVLSLRDFEQKGMSLRIQQLDVTAGKLTLQAAAYIEQFPSS